MARVIYSYPVSEIIGSIGGITFQHNSSGKIARSKPNMTVNPSPAQALQHGKISTLVALWPTLTIAEKTSWTTNLAGHLHVTPWGESKTLNGYQWFLSCNLNLLLADIAARKTAPSWSVIAPPVAFTLTYNSNNLYFGFGDTYSVIPNYLFIYLTLPLRQSSIKLRRSLFLVSVNKTLNDSYLIVTSEFENLAHVIWTDFYSSAHANLIGRIIVVEAGTGLASSFTSSITKVG
jgi:hypothetical protein